MARQYKEWRWQRRYGGVCAEYHPWSWGLGIHVGGYYDDWELIKPKGEADYLVIWLSLVIGPFKVEFSLNGPEKIMPEGKWIPLRDLREGAIFETKDDDVAMKTAYHRASDGECDCYKVANGQRIYYGYGDNELVQELSGREWQ